MERTPPLSNKFGLFCLDVAKLMRAWYGYGQCNGQTYFYTGMPAIALYVMRRYQKAMQLLYLPRLSYCACVCVYIRVYACIYVYMHVYILFQLTISISPSHSFSLTPKHLSKPCPYYHNQTKQNSSTLHNPK